MRTIALALDGPFNGQYINFDTALENNYWFDQWPEVEHINSGTRSEWVWVHNGLLKELDQNEF